MCVEYSGPLNEYNVHGIRHIHIPTPDVCEPQYYDILRGLREIVQFMKDRVKATKFPKSISHPTATLAYNDHSSLLVDKTEQVNGVPVLRRNQRQCNTTGGTTRSGADSESSNVSIDNEDVFTVPPTATATVGTVGTADRVDNDGNSEEMKLFIHCKAGRGRATTFALCYLIFNGHDPEDAMRLLKEKRHVVETYVLHFQCVTQFVRNYRLYLGDLELMIAAEEEKLGMKIL